MTVCLLLPREILFLFFYMQFSWHAYIKHAEYAEGTAVEGKLWCSVCVCLCLLYAVCDVCLCLL